MLSYEALVTCFYRFPFDLPPDCIRLIYQHLAAMRIQKHAFYYESWDWVNEMDARFINTSESNYAFYYPYLNG